MGAPLLCSRLTESGPVSEAAQASLMERLALFNVNWIQYLNAAEEMPYNKVKFLNCLESDQISVKSWDMPRVIESQMKSVDSYYTIQATNHHSKYLFFLSFFILLFLFISEKERENTEL